MKKKLSFIFLTLGLSLWAGSNPKDPYDHLNPRSLKNIQKAIKGVKPSLDEARVERYAKAIQKSALKFEIDPLTLVVIAHQESSFRENLPEGPAGELGMLQIRKNWIENPKLRKHFKNLRMSDLKSPEKAFEIAAWILSDLKRARGKGKLPFWTYYNAKKLKNRLQYYVRVKRHLATIENRIRSPKVREVKLTLSQKRVTSSFPAN